mgnify:CR=1 FL=1
MKNFILLSLSIFALFTLNSFTAFKKINYKVTCQDGSVYYFQCSCGLDAAQGVGNTICKMPVS